MDPENSETNEQDTAQFSTDANMVDIHEAAIEDIDAALANAQAHESGAVSDEPASVDDANTQQPGGQNVAAPGAVPSNPDASQRTYTQAEIQGILAENERRKAEGNQKELFIQHRGNELGTLKTQLATTRSQLAGARAQLANGLEDRFIENPLQANIDRDRIKEIDSQLEAVDGQEERATRIVEAQTLFMRHIDTEKVSLNDVADVLKADGVEDRFISEFKANPWEWTTPEALIQMGKRAADRKEFVTADSDRRLLARHIQYLDGELAKYKARSGQVMASVQKSLNQGPSVNASSGAAPRSANTMDSSRVPMLSDAELNAALANAMRH